MYPLASDQLSLLHGADAEETEKALVSLIKKASSGSLNAKESIPFNNN